jgi:hypothetical protein
MLAASYQDPSMACNNGQQVNNSGDKVSLAKSVQHASFNASTQAGSESLDSLSDSLSIQSAASYWANPGAPEPYQWNPEAPEPYQWYPEAPEPYQGYMMHSGHLAHQQQEQSYIMPVMPQMMPMMPMVVAMIPAAMPMSLMSGMQDVPVVAPAPGRAPRQFAGVGKFDEQSPSPAGEKKERRLEDLLPRGRRPTLARENGGSKIFIGGLNPKTTTEDLNAYFSSFGAVADSSVITDAISKESRGFGFVVFEEKIPEGLFDKQHIIDQRRCGVREYSQSTSS